MAAAGAWQRPWAESVGEAAELRSQELPGLEVAGMMSEVIDSPGPSTWCASAVSASISSGIPKSGERNETDSSSAAGLGLGLLNLWGETRFTSAGAVVALLLGISNEGVGIGKGENEGTNAGDGDSPGDASLERAPPDA